jgi:hypothetical protein
MELEIAEAHKRVEAAQARVDAAAELPYLANGDEYRKARVALDDAEDALLSLCRL